jgi:hypothetical protein
MIKSLHVCAFTLVHLLFATCAGRNETANQHVLAGRQCALITQPSAIDNTELPAMFGAAIVSSIAYVEWAAAKYHTWSADDFAVNIRACVQRDSEDTGDATLLAFSRRWISAIKHAVRSVSAALDRAFYYFISRIEVCLRNFITKILPYVPSYVTSGRAPKAGVLVTRKRNPTAYKLFREASGLYRLGLPVGCRQEQIKLRWFLGNWHEDGWHDTEVILAESDNRVYVSFRGTENAVRLLAAHLFLTYLYVIFCLFHINASLHYLPCRLIS